MLRALCSSRTSVSASKPCIGFFKLHKLVWNDATHALFGGLRKICDGGQINEVVGFENVLGPKRLYASTNRFYDLLQGCINKRDLSTGREVHSCIVRSGFEMDAFLGSHIIRMYALLGSLLEANNMFNRFLEQTTFTWTAIISAHVKLGQAEHAIELYDEMRQLRVKPSEHVFIAVLKACSITESVGQGKLIHSIIIESGCELDVQVGNTLIDMYSKCGSLDDACRVFEKLAKRSVVTWSAMIAGYAQHGHGQEALQLFSQMKNSGIEPNDVTFASIVKACLSLSALDQGMLIHACIIESGVELDVFIGSTLIDMYTKCAFLEDARTVFDKLPLQSVVTWSVMIGGYAQQEQGMESIELFQRMQQESVKPNAHTFVGVLKACTIIAALDEGKLIHALATQSGYEGAEFVANTLVDMYAKCGSLEDAHGVLNRVPKSSVVRWNAMITGYGRDGNVEEAFGLFQRMQQEGLEPDNATVISILKACSTAADLEQGKMIHIHVTKNDCCQLDDMVVSALIHMYATCGNLEDAKKVFDKSPKQDVVTWNTMIAGYAEHRHGQEAADIYQKMQQDCIDPDTVTFISALKAYSSVAAIDEAKLIHSWTIKSGCDLDLSVGNALIDMYAKCGSLEDATKLFDKLINRDVVSWSAVIAGYAHESDYESALQYFQDMQREGSKPNEVTFLSLLSACSHEGLVNEGCQHFKSMKDDYGIAPTVDHCNCMVDLLGRAGRIKQGIDLLDSLPFQFNITGWTSLLSHCRIHGEVELGKWCFDHAVNIDSSYASSYVLMSNIYADAGMSKEAEYLQEKRKLAQAWKKAGKSFIEVDNMIHNFFVGDTSHPRIHEVYKKLRTLGEQFKKGGLLPHIYSVLHQMSDEDKEDYLCGHCEKLAIAFGLISTPPGTPIRVAKNLRVCVDCHSATKVISKIEGREIIVIDSYRTHHFKDGFCSCNDFY